MKRLIMSVLVALGAALGQGTALASSDSNIAMKSLPLPDPAAILAPASPGDNSGKATCTLVAPLVVPKDLIVPPGAMCYVLTGTVVGHDIIVEPNGGLATGGIAVGHDIKADNPDEVFIGDPFVTGDGHSTVGHDVTVDGAHGVLFFQGVCNATIGHNLTVDNSGPGTVWSIGDRDLGCSAGNQVDHDGTFNHNSSLGLEISDNNPANAGGFGHNLIVQNNAVTVVESNVIGHDCRQENNHPYFDFDGDGVPNIAGRDIDNCNTPNP